MFARITKFKMKADMVDEARALMNDLKGEIMGLPGMLQFINAMDDEGNGYIVSVVESREASDANMPRVKELWGKFSHHLEAMPTPEGFEVNANWTSG